MNAFVHPRSLLVALVLSAGALRAQTTPTETALVKIPALVAEITANNPELAFYEAEIEAAKAGVRSAGALDSPEVSLDLGRKRVKDAAGVLAGEGTAWSVSLTQTFEWPGRIALRKAIANRQVELAELGLARFRNALAARARTLSYSLHAAHAEAVAIREVADRFAALKETYLARDPAGITPLLETRVIEAGELVLQRRAAEAELALHAALIELNQLRGANPNAPLRVATPRIEFAEPPDAASLLAAAAENNFEFRMTRVELEQQGYEVRLARHERYPAISVSPFYSQEEAVDRETVVGIGLSVPLPITGRSRGAIAAAETRQRQAEAAAVVAQRRLATEVLTAVQAFATKVAEVQRWSPDAVERFREAAELADRHYRLGAVPVATYVELQNSYLDAVEALLSTQREALEAGLKLQLLTGLDFDAVQIAP